MNKLKY